MNSPGPWINTDGSLYFFLLPYLEQDNLYRSGGNGTLMYANGVDKTPVKTYLSPSDFTAPEGKLTNGDAVANVAANFRVFAVYPIPLGGLPREPVRRDALDRGDHRRHVQHRRLRHAVRQVFERRE